MLKLDRHSDARFEETKRIARVLRLVQLISAQPRVWTRRRLAERFEVGERAIDRDLELIRNGLCYRLRRARAGYFFESGPLLKPIELTVPEVLALALAAQQARDTGTVDVGAIGGVLAKLEQALPGAVVPYLRRAGEHVPSPSGPIRERGTTLAMLEQAMTEGRNVEITYLTASREGARSVRTVSPYHLHLHPYERSWLAIAHDSLRESVIMFNVDRIESCRLTAEYFSVPPDFDPIAYLGSAWGVLRGEAGPPEKVELRFTAQAGRWVCDDIWHASQSTENAPNGDLIMRFYCGITPELVRWVLSFGAEVRVELPQHLRNSVVEEAKRVVVENSTS